MEVVDFTALTPKLFAVFGFSPTGYPLGISKHNLHAIANLAMLRRPNLEDDPMEEGDEEEPTRAPTISCPILRIGMPSCVTLSLKTKGPDLDITLCTTKSTRELDLKNPSSISS